jgi:uncharacterized delta-60 repeat protein
MSGITITDFSGGNSQARSVAIDTSGRIVVAGYSNGENDFALARYLPTGKLDLSFGSTGKITTTIGPGGSIGRSVAIDNSGRIVVAGDYINLSGLRFFALARYTDTGQLDLSFGGTGILTSKFGTEDFCSSVAIDTSNRIVVAGYTFSNGRYNFVVAFYTNDGLLDTTTITDFGGFFNKATSMAIDVSSGRIVVAGYTDVSGHYDFAVACYLANGQLDLSFGTDGKVMTNFGGNSDEIANSVAIDPSSGHIVVAGLTNVSNGQVDFALARYLPTGQPDVSFGTQGQVITNFGGTGGIEDRARSVKIDASGRIVVVGSTDVSGNRNEFALARYLPNGQPDIFFGPTPGGKVITDIDGSNEAYSLAIDSSGRIIVVGSNNYTAGQNFAVACFTDSGFLDESFGDESITVSETAYSVAIDPSGRIVVAGYSTNSRGRDDFALARYTADMVLDLSFGPDGTGKVFTNFGGNETARGLAIDASGRIVVSGSTTVSAGFSIALARYTPTGLLDMSFGTNNTGKVITDFSGNNNAGAFSMAIDPSGRIVVAGFTGSGNLNIDNLLANDLQLDFALARYLPNGILDASFGTNGTGKVSTDFSGNSNEFASSVAIDSGGRIVVAGYTNASGGQYDFAMVRYTTNGLFDASFGKIITDFGRNFDFLTSIAIDTNDRIVLAGGSTSVLSSNGVSELALARYLSNGQLDVTFGTQGKVIAQFSNNPANSAQGIKIDSIDRIVVAGNTTKNQFLNSDFGVARFTSAGILDTTFGNQGAITTDFGNNSFDNANGVAIDWEGRIVVVGSTDVSGGKTEFALARYTTTGALDKTFPASFTYKFLRDFSIISNNLNGFIQDNRTAIQQLLDITTDSLNFTPYEGSILVLVTGPETQITQIQTAVTNGQLYVPINGVLTLAVLPSVSEPPNNIFICFKEGTRILTNTGYVPVETLVPGQLIQTFRHGLVPMRALGRSRVSNIGGHGPRIKNRLYMYRCGCQDASGKKPFADLVVTGEHSALVPSLQYVEKNVMTRHFGSAKTTDDQFHLLAQHDARAVPYEPRGVFTVYHFALECGRDYDRHYGVYANGMLMESCSVNHLKALTAF